MSENILLRPTWPMYMKFVEIICDVDRKKASGHSFFAILYYYKKNIYIFRRKDSVTSDQ